MQRIFAFILLCITAPLIQAQTQGKNEVAMVKLCPPVYSQIAHVANVYGEVEVTVGIERDGTVRWAVVDYGPRLLQAAALESAEKSQFKCLGCDTPLVEYPVLYSFKLLPDIYCATVREGELYPQVSRSDNHVAVTNCKFVLIDPPGVTSGDKVRSIKCLFLWKCAYHRF